MRSLYLDYNATTPVDPRVAKAMWPFVVQHYGNPSSAHGSGQIARAAVDAARRQVATLLGCDASEIVFTSGGSESDNLALKGIALARQHAGNHIITCAIEHPAVLNPLRFLERQGFRVTYLPADAFGRVRVADVADAISSRTILISIMLANNEVGTIQPIAQIARLARGVGIPMHTDASQAVGKIPVNVDELGVDLLTLSGHKLYAPKGTGALYVRRGLSIEPLVHGSGHERGRRAGTENVAGIVALGKAAELAAVETDVEQLQSLRDRLQAGLEKLDIPVRLNGHPTHRLPNTVNLSFDGWNANDLLKRAARIEASTGSACHAGSSEPSPVLLAMRIDEPLARAAVRFSLGRFTTADEIDEAVDCFAAAVSLSKLKSVTRHELMTPLTEINFGRSDNSTSCPPHRMPLALAPRCCDGDCGPGDGSCS